MVKIVLVISLIDCNKAPAPESKAESGAMWARECLGVWGRVVIHHNDSNYSKGKQCHSLLPKCSLKLAKAEIEGEHSHRLNYKQIKCY